MTKCYVHPNAEAKADADVEETRTREWYGCWEDSRTSYLPYLSAKLNNQPPAPLMLNGTEDTGNDKDTTAAEPGLETTGELLETGDKAKTSANETFGSASYHTSIATEENLNSGTNILKVSPTPQPDLFEF